MGEVGRGRGGERGETWSKTEIEDRKRHRSAGRKWRDRNRRGGNRWTKGEVWEDGGE